MENCKESEGSVGLKCLHLKKNLGKGGDEIMKTKVSEERRLFEWCMKHQLCIKSFLRLCWLL